MASSSSVAEFRFRDATIDDVPAIMALILEVARFENEPLENVKTNEQTLARDGFSDSEPKFKVILADHIDSSQNQATKVAGMAFYYFGYSTLAGPFVYLEDLMIEPGFRNRGLGKQLLRMVVQTAKRLGYERVQWSTLNDNETAIRFYEKLGGHSCPQWLTMRMESTDIDSMLANK